MSRSNGRRWLRWLFLILIAAFFLVPRRTTRMLMVLLGYLIMASDKAVSVEQRLNILQTGYGWKTQSLSNGWSGDSLHYRYGMDARVVILKFTGVNPGSGTGDVDAGTIATLPIGYRPNHDCDFPLTVDAITQTTVNQSPHIHVSASSGNIDAYAIASACTDVSLNVHMPIYDD